MKNKLVERAVLCGLLLGDRAQLPKNGCRGFGPRNPNPEAVTQKIDNQMLLI
jgi:hypothetical protein